MKKGPFKMKKFSGFGDSPAKQTFKEKFDKRQASKQKAKDFVKDLKNRKGLPKKGYGLPKEYSLRARKEGWPGFNDKDWSRFEKAHKAANKAQWAKVGKVAGRALGAAGVATTLYDMYKSGQKHSGGKAVKGQKTGIIKPKKSIYKK
tara:strand:- start:46 stop:486 length:441 start_codon:yes stop_codon:yes gene_type:complete